MSYVVGRVFKVEKISVKVLGRFVLEVLEDYFGG